MAEHERSDAKGTSQGAKIVQPPPSASAATPPASAGTTAETHCACVPPTAADGWLSWDMASAVALTGALLAAFMIVWQYRATTRSQLKLALFESLTSRIQTAASAAAKLSAYVRGIPLDLAMARAARQSGGSNPPRARVPHLLELHRTFMDAATEAFVQIEHRAILTPHARLFQLALSSATYDFTTTSMSVNRALTHVLPVDGPAGKPVHIPEPLDGQRQAELQPMLDAYIAAIETLDMYLADIQRELQRILLGSLFRRRHAERRTPMDARYRVIATDRKSAKELERYFLEDSAWGINNRGVESEVAASLAAEGRLARD